MKKLAAAAICGVLVLMLTGCGNVTVKGEENGQSDTRIVSTETGVFCSILTDTETGVQYLMVGTGGYGCSVTPLLKADGTPYVEG